MQQACAVVLPLTAHTNRLVSGWNGVQDPVLHAKPVAPDDVGINPVYCVDHRLAPGCYIELGEELHDLKN